MILRIEDGLPLAAIELRNGYSTITIKDVLIDTGCAVTIFFDSLQTTYKSK